MPQLSGFRPIICRSRANLRNVSTLAGRGLDLLHLVPLNLFYVFEG